MGSVLEDTFNKKDDTSGESRRLKKGDVIYTNRAGGVYQHYGVYIGNEKVIHYASRSGDFGDDICVHETTLDDFLKGGECFAINFSENYDWGKYRKNASLRVPGIIGPLIPNESLITAVSKIIRSSQYHLYSAEETVERARSKIGESEYNLVINNCEHFAVWCKTGLSESKQVEAVLGGFQHLPIMIH
ncbi:hypothetical protein FACS189442_0390 [Spirochaetia bacterium]|nr:hypothetical protein FACS189442_0390 [Spirochaetia bacterium]